MTTVTGSDGLTYTYDESTHTLTISGTGTFISSIYKCQLTGLDARGMTSLVIADGITEISATEAFRGATSLVNITWPSITYINEASFRQCTSLQELVFPTTLDTLKYNAFDGCSSLNKVVFKSQPTTLGSSIFTNSSSAVTVYSTGWANSSTVGSQFSSGVTVTYVDSIPDDYVYLKVNGKKIQVDSAIRDGNGLRIDTKYLKKTDVATPDMLKCTTFNFRSGLTSSSTMDGYSTDVVYIDGMMRYYDDGSHDIMSSRAYIAQDYAPRASSHYLVQSGGVYNALDGKLDKVTSSGNIRVYAIATDGTQTTLNVVEGPYQASIPWRTLNGRLKVGTPTDDNDATTMAFVNSSIATNTATFRGTYDAVTDLSFTQSAVDAWTNPPNSTVESSVITAIATKMTALSITPTNNDYCFVCVDQTPVGDVSADWYWRFKYNGTSWAYEYSLNNTGFTSAQWNAINSGVTTSTASVASSLASADYVAKTILWDSNAHDSFSLYGWSVANATGMGICTINLADTYQKKQVTTTVTIATTDWSSNACTKSVTGVTASNTVVVSPAPSSITDYGTAGIYCSAQGSGTLTFTCTTTPTSSISVNVLILN